MNLWDIFMNLVNLQQSLIVYLSKFMESFLYATTHLDHPVHNWNPRLSVCFHSSLLTFMHNCAYQLSRCLSLFFSCRGHPTPNIWGISRIMVITFRWEIECYSRLVMEMITQAREHSPMICPPNGRLEEVGNIGNWFGNMEWMINNIALCHSFSWHLSDMSLSVRFSWWVWI